MTAANRVCGKQTRKGAACRREPHWWTEGLTTRYADGCWRHMSEAFREAYESRKQADEAAWLAYLYADPICWLWSVPEGVPVAGLSEEQASALLALWHGGRCAICGHRDGVIDDHDHATGLVRGHLCQSCNIKEGIYWEPDCLFGKYRGRHPAKMLGLEIRYWDPLLKDYARPATPSSEADKWTDAASEDIGL